MATLYGYSIGTMLIGHGPTLEKARKDAELVTGIVSFINMKDAKIISYDDRFLNVRIIGGIPTLVLKRKFR